MEGRLCRCAEMEGRQLNGEWIALNRRRLRLFWRAEWLDHSVYSLQWLKCSDWLGDALRVRFSTEPNRFG